MRILFVKLGAIGDVVQAAVAWKEYRRRTPGIQLDWVIGQRVRPLIEAFNIADTVIPIDDDGLYAASAVRKLTTLVKSSRRTASWARYDRVVTAYSDWRYRLLTLGTFAGARQDFKPRGGRPALIQHRNRVHEYWRLLSGGDSEAIDVAAAAGNLGREMVGIPDVSARFPLPKRFVAIAPGGARNLARDDALRRWPIDNYLQLTEALIAAGHEVVLLGGGSDKWVSDALAQLPTIDLIGKTDLLELLAILRRSEVFVGNDSGILHLATLTQTAIVALFGPTPANAVMPLGRARSRVMATQNRVSCSPCYDGRNFADCNRNICLEAITVASVNSAVTELLGRDA